MYRPQGPIIDRPWLDQVHWESILEDFHLGHALKDIWQERLREVTSYSNFWKAFYQKYPELKLATVTLREFEPGERVEIDWAGGIIPWADPKTGQVFEARVFIGVLGFSQLFFATAKEDMKSRNFLECHQEMFESFGGLPRIVVPDCLKTGVSKCHLYDPDLNAAYSDLAAHYGVAIVPARPKHPKDKPFVEGGVRIILRSFRWIYRKHTFQSVHEIQQALKKTYELLNQRPHTRFRVSRFERFEKVERATLKNLPTDSYEVVEWKEAKVHPDCHVSIDGAYYSVPHAHRGQKVRVKLTKNRIEIFLNLERLCTHGRDRRRLGRRVTEISHLPENSRAYREATPQNLLSQARFISPDLYELLKELFELDAIGHLRRAQGFLREAQKFSQLVGSEIAKTHFKSAIEQMKRFEKIRVPYFKEILKSLQKQTQKPEDREVERDLINPWLRYPEKENKNVSSPSQKPLPRDEAPGLPLLSR
jgi:transposase